MRTRRGRLEKPKASKRNDDRYLMPQKAKSNKDPNKPTGWRNHKVLREAVVGADTRCGT